jgi:hypothetical protein
MVNLLNNNPSSTTQVERRGEKTREGVKSVVGFFKRMKSDKVSKT